MIVVSMIGSKWQKISVFQVIYYILGACYRQMCMTLERIFNNEELNGLLI